MLRSVCNEVGVVAPVVRIVLVALVSLYSLSNSHYVESCEGVVRESYGAGWGLPGSVAAADALGGVGEALQGDAAAQL